MNRFVKALALVALGSVAAVGYAQNQDPNPNPNVKAIALRGRFLRTEGTDRIVVRTADNKEVILWSTPTTRYVVNRKVVRVNDLREGADLNATYVTRDNRYYVSNIQVGEGAAAADANTAFRGRVTAKTAETITVKSETGKEMVFNTNAQSQYKLGTKAITVNDIKVGAIVEVRFVERDSHTWVQELIINDVSTGNTDQPGEEMKGVVVRVIGQNQIVVRTADNKEVIVDVVPQTVYKFNDQPARLADFPAGSDVRVQYNVLDRRPVARGIFGLRRP